MAETEVTGGNTVDINKVNKDRRKQSGKKIDWDKTNFGDGNDNTTSTDTRHALTQALKDGDKNLAKFYQDKLRQETHAFGRQ